MWIGPLKHRDFRLLWTGWVLSTTAGWVFRVVSMWLIFELTDSPLMLGVSGIFMSVPFLITSLYGGAFADRLDRRKLLLTAQLILTVVAVIPGVLSFLDVIEVWHLYVISFFISTLGGFDSPARDALVPTLVPREELMRATAFTTGIHRSTALIGPTIGGFGISLLGVSGTFFVYALLHGLVFLAILSMRAPVVKVETPKTSITRSIVEGFQCVIENRILWGVLSLGMVHTFFVTSQTLMPVFARDILQVGPTGLGFLYASSGLGALLGSSLSIAMGDVRKKGPLLFISDFSKPLALVLFALSSWMPASMLLLVYGGIFDIVGSTVRRTILQLTAEPHVRGRVFSMNMMVNRGLGPLSGLQSGALASLVGAPAAIATGAALFVVYGIFLFFRVPEVYRYPAKQSKPRLAQSQGSKTRPSLGQ